MIWINNLLLIEVPKDATDFRIKKETLTWQHGMFESREETQLTWSSTRPTHNFLVIPTGCYSVIGVTDELTESVAEKIVGLAPYVNYVPQNLLDKYRESIWCQTALESFKSLLRQNKVPAHKRFFILKKK